MNRNYLSLGLVIFSVLMVFTLSEILNRVFKIKPEITRKFSHVLAGIITISFPVLFNNQLFVLILALSFFAFLLVSRYYTFLESVNNINRHSFGTLAYPVGIYSCFLCYSIIHKPIYYYLPVLILIISDPLAAYFGLEKKWRPYNITGEVKSLGGSLAFFVSTLVISIIILFLVYPNHTPIFSAILIACVTTITEGISTKGLDNVSVPLACMGILYFVT